MDNLLVVLIPALVGAAYMAYTFNRAGRSVPLGAGIGTVAGGVGALLFMVPLQFCTFEPDREPIDLAFGVGLVTIGTMLALAMTQWLVRYLRGEVSPDTQTVRGAFKGTLAPWLLLAPTLIILILFLYYPFLDTFRLSTLLTRLGAPRSKFVCVDNFTELLEPDYIQILVNTIWMSAAIVILGLVFALAIAYLAYQPVKGVTIYRTLLIWPYAISPPIAGIIFFVMFNPVAGVINHFLGLVGLPEPDWFGSSALAPWTIVLASVWKTLGYNILFYIAGLQTVPQDQVEAAAIDGANAWQRFRNVVLPALSPITFFLIVTNITYAFFDIFGTIDYMTKGAPAGATNVMIYQIYLYGISSRGDLGRAAAQSVMLFILVIGITVLQFRTSGRRVTYGA